MSKAAGREDDTTAEEAVPLERCLTRLVNPQRVASVRERLPSAEIADELAATFRVLAEPARVKIVSALLEAGELCVCDLAASVGLSETATSQHLRISAHSAPCATAVRAGSSTTRSPTPTSGC